MSHFPVLVVTDEQPTQAHLEEVLLPWHEYECTGVERYLQWVDKTDEVLADYAQRSDRSLTLARFAEHDYGCQVRPDGRIGRLTNPNKKWDWWVIGGRWSGQLRACGSTVDQARRADLDLEGMRSVAVGQCQALADDCCQRAGRTLADLAEACRVAPLVRAAWLTLPEPRPRGKDYLPWARTQDPEWAGYAHFESTCWTLPSPSPSQTLSDWIAAAPPLSTWAVVMNGQWFEKGKMGWWGMSSDDKEDWEDRFTGLFGLIRPEQWVSVVDCHI